MTGPRAEVTRADEGMVEARNGVASRHAPLPPRTSVARHHLFDRLDAGTAGLLTLVTGPAGAGKTVLLSTWLTQRSRPHPVVWLSLEPSYGQPGRFWGELLKLVREAVGPAAVTLPDPSDAVDDDFLAAVASAVDALPQPVLIVLDSFERMRSKRTLESLDLFLHIPQQGFRLMIVSRRDPNLSLQRLRLAGELTEVRARDLAFSQREAEELCALSDLRLSDLQVAKLQRRTEGWVGGLSLAALSLRDHSDPDEFVDRFAGDDRTVADYLVEEVLHQQPPPIRDFMLRTSVVDVIEPDLADALTGRAGSAVALSVLERSNAFLIPLDEQRHRFRYHPMFQELLRSQLRYRMPDAYALEHRLASRWYAAHDMASEAIRHAIAADDTTSATELVCEHWLSIVLNGNAELLMGWIDGLEQRIPATRPELAIAAAGTALSLGNLDEAERYMALADAKAADIPAKRRARYARSWTVVTMLGARIRGDVEVMRTAAQKVLRADELLGSVSCLRAVALLHLGVAEHWEGDSEAGVSRLEESLEVARRDECGLVVVDCLGQLALFKALAGALRDSVAASRAAIRIAVQNGWDERGAAANAYLSLGIAHLNWGELEMAGQQLDRAAFAARDLRTRTTMSLIGMCRAMTLAREDIAEAIRVARTARRDVERWQLPDELARLADLCEAVLLADAGDAEGSEAALERGGAVDSAPRESAVIRARLMLADGDPSEALRLLRPHFGAQGQLGRPAARIEALALGSVAEHLLHDDEVALELLEQALAAAQPDGYRLPFLRAGVPLRDLLRRRVRAGTRHRALAGELIEMLDAQRGEDHEHPPRLLLDPLSDREEAVLRYLPTGMSKAEIASELFVSVNTVKTHTQNIYRKLGVSTRAGAVRRARQLNLM